MREDWGKWGANEADNLYHLLSYDRPSWRADICDRVEGRLYLHGFLWLQFIYLWQLYVLKGVTSIRFYECYYREHE